MEAFFNAFYDNLVSNPQLIEGKAADNEFLGTKSYPQIIKTANSKPADNEARLYFRKVNLAIFLFGMEPGDPGELLFGSGNVSTSVR